MGKIIHLINSNKKLFFVVLIVLSCSSIFYVFIKTKKTASTQTNIGLPEKVDLNTIKPGVSTKEDVFNTLGTPLEEKKENSSTSLYYPSNSKVRRNEVVLENETTKLIKEMITASDTRKTEDITQKYGIANYILYGQDAYSGFYLFVYPDKGVAYLGNPNSGDLLEIWTFEPMGIEIFKKLYTSGYSESLSPQQ